MGLPGVVPALAYLTASNRKGLGDHVPEFESGTLDAAGKDVVVVGGGDTAMDCVRTAVRQGARSVKCLYRRDRGNMPGSVREVQHAEEEGVEFVWLSAPEAFLGDDGVNGVRAVRMRLGLPDATGRQAPEPVPGSGFRLAADLVVNALGFDPEDLGGMFGEPRLKLSRWGTVTIDWDTMMTSLPGVFAGGDIVRGASLVVWGVRDGRDAAAGIHRFLAGEAADERPALALRILTEAAMADFLESGDEFLTAYAANVERLRAAGADDLELERDGCGVGCVVAIDGKPRREVVVKGIEALKAVWHRGAVDADGKTGDGAGIHVQIPQDFFREQIKGAVDTETKARGRHGVPAAQQLRAQERAGRMVESEILRFGYAIHGWRQVPVDTSVLGEKARRPGPRSSRSSSATRSGVDEDAFERDLYVIRRRIEKPALADNITDFYICSLSCRSVIYKGMFLAEQLAVFYPDLQGRALRLELRASTTSATRPTRFPTWKLAQPFRVLAHNGEINTLQGNVNWMRSHETRMASEVFGPYIDDMKPVIQPGGSDSAALDNVFEVLVRAGRQLPMVKTLLIPEAWSHRTTMPAGAPRPVQLLQLRDGAVGRPGRALRHRRPLGHGRHGPQRPAPDALRPHRRRPADRRLRGRHGAARGDRRASRRAASGPAQMIAVDLAEGALYRDREIKDYLAAPQALRQVGREHHGRRRTMRPSGRRAAPTRPRGAAPPPARRRHHHGGPGADPPPHGARTARRRSARWATTRRWPCSPSSTAACTTSSGRTSARSPTRRSTRLRETARDEPARPGSAISATSSTRTRASAGCSQLESPVLTTAEFEAMRGYMGEQRAPRSTAPSTGATAARCARATRSTASAARPRTRCAAAAVHVILSDEHVSGRAARRCR